MNQAWLQESAASLRSRMSVQSHDDGTGNQWTFTACLPHPSIGQYVNTYWEVRGSYAHLFEKVLPTADIVVIFNLGPASTLCDRDEYSRAVPYSRAFVSGLQHEFLVISSPEGSWNCGIRLTPIGASRLLGVPMHEVTSKVIDLEDILGGGAGQLLDRLRNAASSAERFVMIDDALRQRLGKRELSSTVAMADWAWSAILTSEGSARVRDLARETGWSRKHLRHVFLQHVGMTPKSVARLVRFHAVLTQIGFQKHIEWSQVAQACGYADQAHFNRDFRAFSGDTPQAYLKSRVPDSEPGFMMIEDER